MPPGPPGPRLPAPPSGGVLLLQAASMKSAPATAKKRTNMMNSPLRIGDGASRHGTIRRSRSPKPRADQIFEPRPQKGGGLYRHELAKQGRPGRVGSVPRRFYLPLITPGKIDRMEVRGAAASLAEIHQHATVRRPSRPLDQEILGQQPLAGAVRPHHPDIERAALDFRERDQIAARRPYRGAVFPRAEADPFGVAAIGAHDIELLRAAAVGVEHDLAAVRRE